MSHKRKITFNKPPEPKFLKKFKQRAGYVSGPDIETKKETLPEGELDDRHNIDELPVVVQLESGDITQEEAEFYWKEKDKEILKDELLNKKIIFRKPENMPKQSKDCKRISKSKQKNEKSISSKKVKNLSLLSFDEYENDDK